MAELQLHPSSPHFLPPPESSNEATLPPPPPSAISGVADHKPPQSSLRPRYDPSRMIGVIRRKALIKDLAAIYHAECLAYCQELMDLQRKCEEPYIQAKATKHLKKETMRPPKRLKKSSGKR